MFIRLNCNPSIACARLYVWSTDTLNPTTYRFWHNAKIESLQSSQIPPVVEGDLFLTFESNMKLDEWVAKIKTSEFNNPKSYRFFQHNCANAALFGLQTANISLEYAQTRISQLKLCLTQWKLPITPKFLFDVVKQDKLNQIKSANRDSVFRDHESQILKWRDSEEAKPLEREKKLVDDISADLNKRETRFPEHVEAHIDALMQTYKLVTQFPEDSKDQEKACEQYVKLSEQFKQRKPTVAGRQRVFLILLSGLSVYGLMGVGFYNGYRLLSRSSLSFGYKSLSLVAGIAISLFKLPRLGKGSYLEETPLSQNMKQLTEVRRRQSSGSS